MKKNLEKAEKYFRDGMDAAEREDLEAAVTLYKKACAYGSDDAANNLGYIYDVEPRNSAEDPIKWYKLGARRGSRCAAYNLALENMKSGNLKRYKYWLKRAVSLGYEDAYEGIKSYMESYNIKSCNHAPASPITPQLDAGRLK